MFKKEKKKINIVDLYPELTSEQQADAEYRLLGYLEIVTRIFERVCHDHPELLTELEERATLRKKGNLRDRQIGLPPSPRRLVIKS